MLLNRSSGGLSRLWSVGFRLFHSATPISAQAAAAAPVPKAVPISKLTDGFLDGTSSSYLEELEERFKQDPQSVDKTWASFFNSLGEGQAGCACCCFRVSAGPDTQGCFRCRDRSGT